MNRIAFFRDAGSMGLIAWLGSQYFLWDHLA